LIPFFVSFLISFVAVVPQHGRASEQQERRGQPAAAAAATATATTKRRNVPRVAGKAGVKKRQEAQFEELVHESENSAPHANFRATSQFLMTQHPGKAVGKKGITAAVCDLEKMSTAPHGPLRPRGGSPPTLREQQRELQVPQASLSPTMPYFKDVDHDSDSDFAPDGTPSPDMPTNKSKNSRKAQKSKKTQPSRSAGT
jgi:hypothetical protein